MQDKYWQKYLPRFLLSSYTAQALEDILENIFVDTPYHLKYVFLTVTFYLTFFLYLP